MKLITNEQYKCGSIEYFSYFGITCYILHGKNGDLLIDTGIPFSWKKMSKWLEKFHVKYVFLTHGHIDHDYNALKLQEHGAQIYLSEKDRILRRKFLSQVLKPVFPRYIFRNIVMCVNGAFLRSPFYEADHYFTTKDKEILKEIGFDAELVMLPGHTYGSTGILSGDVLYCGDAFTALWKRPDICPNVVNRKRMQKSLRTILKVNPKWLACGHGLPLKMTEARPVIEEYLANTLYKYRGENEYEHSTKIYSL